MQTTKQYRRNTRDLLRLADMMSVKASVPAMCERLAISDITLFRYYGRELEAAGYPILGQRREPTDAQRKMVSHLKSIGVSIDNICAAMDHVYTPETLRKYFARELEKGTALLDIRLRHALVDAATTWHRKGEKMPVTAVSPLIFLGKAVLGLKETGRTELTGPDGEPIQVQHQHAVVILPDNGRDERPALEDDSQQEPEPEVLTIEGQVVDVTDQADTRDEGGN